MSEKRSGVDRRRFLLGAGAVVGAGAVADGVAGCGTDAKGHAKRVAATEHASGPVLPTTPPKVTEVSLGTQPHGLPARQHAWGDTLRSAAAGDPIAPRFDRLLFFDVIGKPGAPSARLLEAALRTLERSFRWGPSGLLFTAGWSPHYFERVLGVESPIPQAKGLSDFEEPSIDEYDLCLHLACDDESRLADVEAALVHGEALRGADGPLNLSTALRWRETRTGFVGAGLPAAHQHTGGIPSGDPVAKSAPLFMGFKSNLKKNQATEDSVTIPDGPFAGGTTMSVSYMRLRLQSWYQDLSYKQRVQRMYAPQVTPEDVAGFTTDAESDPQKLGQAINHYGVIGHSQSSARARRHNKPLIIRRDFNTVDGGQAGLHFVSVQKSIADFVTTRTAMNQTSAQLQNPAISSTDNNGINEFIFVLKRANYILPARAHRAFPLLAE